MEKDWLDFVEPMHKKIWADSGDRHEKGDCAVKAIAVAAKWEYREAHAALKKHGRCDGKGTKKGLVEAVLELAGYSVTEIDRSKVWAKTITNIKNDELFSHGTYIVRTRGHVLCVVDGKPVDWTAGRRHRIKQVFRVEPLNVCKKYKDQLVGDLDAPVKVKVNDTSHCTRCGCDKPVVAFSKDKSRKNGLDTWCKLCTKEQRQASKRPRVKEAVYVTSCKFWG